MNHFFGLRTLGALLLVASVALGASQPAKAQRVTPTGALVNTRQGTDVIGASADSFNPARDLSNISSRRWPWHRDGRPLDWD